ncbi:trehalase-like [Planococcus citri]|uniref:trehalase-like n=1 Tax=Planococcus citri TaxID=170843 RepID=UPI0031F9A069
MFDSKIFDMLITIIVFTLVGVSDSDGVMMFVKAKKSCKDDRYVEIEKIKGPVPDKNGCIPDCDSKIFCIGKDDDGQTTLLHDIQTSGLYYDSTAFLKHRMKYSEAEILKNYNEAKMNATNNHLSNEELKKFIDDNFVDGRIDSQSNVILTDFHDNPPILQQVNTTEFHEWLSYMNRFWRDLSRKLLPAIKEEEKSIETMRSSYIYVPHTFIVAGGRFDEMYYWDSYWIIKGLLACGMRNTTKGIIGNMIHLVKKFGYVPNGNRIYYSKRSHPPMLIQMVDSYYQATNDECIIKENLRYLEAEFDWWLKNRNVTVKIDGRTYYLFRYNALSCFPRPESYKEDLDLVNYLAEDLETTKSIYTGTRSALESGWEFSSRHMRNPKNAQRMPDGLRDMNPRQFAYVDLISIMYSNAKRLSEWERNFAENNAKADEYDEWASKFLDAIENVLWNEEEGMWLDYDILSKKNRKYFYASNFVPLWSKAYKNNHTKVQLALKYLEKNQMIHSNLENSYCGIPTSGVDQASSLQTWDYPSVMAPLQSFIIRGLKESNDPTAEKVAYHLATSFMKTAYAAYLNDGVMYEKYDASVCGKKGEKGEYPCQIGFGWTNGVIFELFSLWNCFPLSPNIRCPSAPEI